MIKRKKKKAQTFFAPFAQSRKRLMLKIYVML